MSQNKEKIRLLHAGDLHIGSAFLSLPPALAEARRAAFYRALADMTSYVCREHIDVLLMSGDIFDADAVTPDTVDVLHEIITGVSAEVFITPGNRDPYTADSVYAAGFPVRERRLHVFRDEGLQKVLSEELPITVMGWAFTSRTHTPSPLAGYHADNDGRLQIVVGHTSDGMVKDSDIDGFGAHYAALSGDHTGGGIRAVGDGRLAGVSGAFMGRNYGEPGVGGAIELLASRAGDSYIVEGWKVSFSDFRYETATLDVTGVADIDGLTLQVRQAIDRGGYNAETALRLTLTGMLPPRFPMYDIENRRSAWAAGLNSLTIVDETVPVVPGEAGIRGEICRTFAPALQSESPDERAVAAIALRAALAALDGRPIADG